MDRKATYEADRQRLEDLQRQREADPGSVSQQEVTDAYWQADASFNDWYRNTETPASRYIDRVVNRALGIE